jgi:hypothetical protein
LTFIYQSALLTIGSPTCDFSDCAARRIMAHGNLRLKQERIRSARRGIARGGLR